MQVTLAQLRVCALFSKPIIIKAAACTLSGAGGSFLRFLLLPEARADAIVEKSRMQKQCCFENFCKGDAGRMKKLFAYWAAAVLILACLSGCTGAGRVTSSGPGSSAARSNNTKTLQEESTMQLNTTPAAPLPALHVQGTQLVNEAGDPVQLRGISTHGLGMFPEYVNYEAFRTLHDTWDINVIRLAMYTQEDGGYCSDGDKEQLKQLVRDGVEYATRLGMYVIIDWHILSDNDPNIHYDEANAFFAEMSAAYKDSTNVIYEICNEPHESPWVETIKPYAEKILSTIRQNDPDALVLVGTNTWSQDVTEVAGHQLDDPNVMYVLHFYAGTHKDELRKKLTDALAAGVPVFISECSICTCDGSGRIDYDSAQAWLDLITENNLSYIEWNLSNKNETSAIIKPGCSALSGWTDDDLSDTGIWFKQAFAYSASHS
jgi:aryl-phospho-beta-D-glucosidase BglC (GH1 family)